MTAEPPTKPLAQVRVSVFDDSIETLERFAAVLKASGARVFPSSSPELGEDLRKDLVSFAPELIIVDLIMGESRADGYKLIKQIKQEPRLRDVPLVVCSKLINTSTMGQTEKGRVEELLGTGTAYSKLPDIPTASELSRHVRKPAGPQGRTDFHMP